MQYSPDEQIITKINSARNPKEIELVLRSIRSKISSISSSLPTPTVTRTKLNLTSVSAGLEIHEADGSLNIKENDGSTPKAKPIRLAGQFPRTFPVLTAVDEAQLMSTKDSTVALGKLEGILRELGSMRQVVMGRGFSLPSKKALLKAIESSGAEAHKMVNIAKRSLNKVSKSNSQAIPAVHYSICAGAFNLLKNPRILDESKYSDILYKKNASNTTFVLSKSDTTYMIQTYIRIEDLINNEDYSYEQYIVVVTGVVELLGEGEALINYYVTSIKNDRTPGSFPIGKTPVKDPADFKRRVSSLLSIDGFIGNYEKKPFRKTTKELRDTSTLNGRSVAGGVDIASVRIAEGSILAHLKSGTEEEFKATVTEIMSAIRGTFKLPKTATIQYKVKPKRHGSRLYVFEHIQDSHGATKAVFTNSKINMIADVLELTAAQKSELRNSLK